MAEASARSDGRNGIEVTANRAARTREAMLVDFRNTLDSVALRAGWRRAELRSEMFRHTHYAARLQTLGRRAPVSAYTVAREVGHGGEAMVRRVYGHLGQVRHQSEAVEFRIEQERVRLNEAQRAALDALPRELASVNPLS